MMKHLCAIIILGVNRRRSICNDLNTRVAQLQIFFLPTTSSPLIGFARVALFRSRAIEGWRGVVRSMPMCIYAIGVYTYCYDTGLFHPDPPLLPLRTSDLDTEFFHTDMKVLADHFHGQPTILYCVPTNPGPRSFCARPVRWCR